MRLIRAHLRQYRLHRDLRVDFDPKLTVIGGPNESGKSTLVEALHRALFLKAKGATEHHRSMQPRDEAGASEVELEFEIGPERFHLHKKFGSSGTIRLQSASLGLLTGEAAEEALQRVLATETVGKKDLPGQWAHLWVWQGQSGEDPSDHANARRDMLLRRLQPDDGSAAIRSALDARIARRFADTAASIFVKGDKPKAGSELERATEAIEKATAAREQALARMRVLDDAAREFEETRQQIERATLEIAQLEHDSARLEARVTEINGLRLQEAHLAAAAKGAAEADAALASADDAIRKAAASLRQLEIDLQPHETAQKEAEQALVRARSDADAAEAAHRQAVEATRTARRTHDLATAQLQRLDAAAALRQAEERLGQVAGLRSRAEQLDSQLAALPRIEDADLGRLGKLDNSVVRADAALHAAATGIEVTAADLPVRLGNHPIATGTSTVVTEDSELQVGEGVRIRIRPGGGTSLATARQAATDARAALVSALQQLGVADLPAASQAHARRATLGAELRGVRDTLLGLDPTRIETEAAQARISLAAAEAAFERSGSQPPGSTDVREAREALAAAQSTLSAAEKREADALKDREERSTRRAAAEAALQKRIEQAAALRQQSGALAAKLQVLTQTHGDDTTRARRRIEADAASKGAQGTLHACREAIATLQPETIDRDRDRLRRALDALKAARDDAHKRHAVAESRLRSDGSTDVRAELAEAEAQFAEATNRHRSVRRHADAIQLLDRLFKSEQSALAESFTRPLSERVGAYLRPLFGAGVSVQLSLGESGFGDLRLGRAGDAGEPFEFSRLSGGTREQFAAAVRLAMAEILAADHGGCLPIVFDDAFAATDRGRLRSLQGMLDLAASKGLQVLVLTCDPEAYAGLGACQIQLGQRR